MTHDQMIEVLKEVLMGSAVTHIARAVGIRVQRCERWGEYGIVHAAVRQCLDYFHAVTMIGGKAFVNVLVQYVHSVSSHDGAVIVLDGV